jgi:hypothetical protein
LRPGRAIPPFPFVNFPGLLIATVLDVFWGNSWVPTKRDGIKECGDAPSWFSMRASG